MVSQYMNMKQQWRCSHWGTRTSSSSVVRTRRQGRHRSLYSRVHAGLGDSFKDLFDFAKWAPRSSQAWRLGQKNSKTTSDKGVSNAAGSMTEEDVNVLNQRLFQSRSMDGDERSYGSDGDDDKSNDDDRTRMARSSRDDALETPSSRQPSFMGSTDEEFADALNARITEVAHANGIENMAEEGDESGQLTGTRLLDLIYAKYGKKHDMSFVKRDIPGKTIVSLNIYHAYLGQKSFPMTQEEFEDKLEGVAFYLEVWGQVDRVVGFLQEPITPRRGLPSRPIVGNAVSIQLDLSREQIEEWFSR